MKHLVLVIILATMISLPLVAVTTSLGRLYSSPTVSVDPTSLTVQLGQEFVIDINIDYVINLYGYQVYMSFDNNKLNASLIEYRGFLNNNTNIWDQEENNAAGYVSLAVTSLRPAPPKSGGSPPPLATVHFKAIGQGISFLHLYKTILADNQGIAISHTTQDGQVTVTTAGGHDIAVTNVASSKTVICKGYFGSIAVTAQNWGAYTETFNATLYANQTIIGILGNTTLTSGAFTTLMFNWNTSGLAYGSYLLKAAADVVPGENSTTNNNCTGGWVRVSIVGDLTGLPNVLDFIPDGLVDMTDVGVVASFFLIPIPPAPANCDLTGPTPGMPDGTIDMMDIGTIAAHFLEHE